MRLAEAIKLIRRLWTEERVDFEGEYYRTERATIYDRPDEPVPDLRRRLRARSRPSSRAASATASSARAARTPSSTRSCSPRSREGAEQAGRDPDGIERMIEIKVSYDHDVEYAREACGWWAALALTPEEKTGIEDPIEMERLADAALDRAPTRFIVSDDPDEVVERIAPYVELGFEHLVFHAPGHDQARFLEQFSADVLPRLRARFG